jgi:hypothetical protein
MYVIELIMIQIIVVFLIDLSGAIQSLKRSLSLFLTNNRIKSDAYTLPLIGCSLCMTFWSGLAYLIITHNLSITGIFIVCLLSYLTTVTYNILLFIRDLIIKYINSL